MSPVTYTDKEKKFSFVSDWLCVIMIATKRFQQLYTKCCTHVFGREIFVELVNGHNRFNLFKMVAILNI